MFFLPQTDSAQQIDPGSNSSKIFQSVRLEVIVTNVSKLFYNLYLQDLQPTDI